MSRRSVETTPMIVVKKKIHKDLGGGSLGTRQVRKANNTVRSPKLAKHNACVAGKMAGQNFTHLGSVQENFKKATKECKANQ